ncbi:MULTISPECIES: MFS transporter [unclassified Geobacillus]|jgi:MFS family permease|uniref:MFS transporter n=1 Tax=unclassified Geobacillus TaxID=2642459 RepID=UPI000BE46250|nr:MULTISPECIES: MFS transporter [unclassified Geobacillus]PDM38981.1 MFS transporter [Parageobacillus yumthangensis]PUF90154.1 MFS transporter [Geobacillus sp. LYN3]RDV23425.1 MFS transporter [Parageobacillus toebii]TXK88555.1 MFS transporter [Geobacillus sp. AYS3]
MIKSIKFLRHERSYRRLFISGFISGVGDWFNNVAVLSIILTLTGSSLAVGITLALRVLPYLVFGPLGGMVADRIPRKIILVTMDLTRSVLALSFLFVNSKDQIWIVYVVTFGLVILSTFYIPARAASIPTLVRKENLLTANALDQTSFGIVMIIGSVSGAFFTAIWGLQFAFIFNSVSFLVSALLTMGITFPRTGTKSNKITYKEQIKSFLSLCKKSRLLRAIIVLSALWPVGGGAINVLLSVYSFQVFDMGQQGVGIFYGSLGLGFVIGGIFADYISQNLKKMAAAGFILEGISLSIVSVSPYFSLASLMLFLGTVGSSIGIASTNTLVMEAVSIDEQGKVFGTLATLRNSILGISMFVAGLLLEWIQPRVLGFLGGILITIVGALVGILLVTDPSKQTFQEKKTC